MQWNLMYKHAQTIIKHKSYVFYYSIVVGIPIQGFFHDFSKFSPSEFLNNYKYYRENGTPITHQRKELGYSLPWVHHPNKNKHHWQYWLDIVNKDLIIPAPMPKKYLLEMFIDMLSASKTYNAKDWNPIMLYDYWTKSKGTIIMHESTFAIYDEMITLFCIKGFSLKQIKSFLNKQ